jgi:hypothetical protein
LVLKVGDESFLLDDELVLYCYYLILVHVILPFPYGTLCRCCRGGQPSPRVEFAWWPCAANQISFVAERGLSGGLMSGGRNKGRDRDNLGVELGYLRGLWVGWVGFLGI